MSNQGLYLTKHFSLTSSQRVNEVCKRPLESIGITYFNYLKINNQDSSRALLTNNAEWIEHFYKTELYRSVETVNIEHLLPKGYFLWSELNTDDAIYKEGREFFNIDNGITFVIKHKTYTYLYIFASTKNNPRINDFYLRNIDLLRQFILYFNDQAHDLIQLANSNPILLPEQQPWAQKLQVKHNELIQQQRDNFYSHIKINNYCLPGGVQNDIILTKKQAECLGYLLTGATSKQIAKMMKVSPRTIEAHIDTIKDKLFSSYGKRFTKRDLIAFVNDTGLNEILTSAN